MGYQNFLMLDGYQRRALSMFREQNGMTVDGYSKRTPRILEDTLVATHTHYGVEISGTYDMGMENYSSCVQIIPWGTLLEVAYSIQLEAEHIKVLKRVAFSMEHEGSIRSLHTREARWANVTKRLGKMEKYPATYRATADEARAMLFGTLWMVWDAEQCAKTNTRYEKSIEEYDALMEHLLVYMPLPVKSFGNFKNY